LTELFELTKAEAAIVPLLLSGVTADHVANLRGVSLLTIQSQIRHILAKTGSANLRALAALVIPLCD
jgi:DNA-binding CsgD family transcriptional regulator